MPAGVDGSINSGYQSDSTPQTPDDVGHYIMTMCSTTHIQSPVVSDAESSQERDFYRSGNMFTSNSFGSNLSTKSTTSSALRVEVSGVETYIGCYTCPSVKNKFHNFYQLLIWSLSKWIIRATIMIQWLLCQSCNLAILIQIPVMAKNLIKMFIFLRVEGQISIS